MATLLVKSINQTSIKLLLAIMLLFPLAARGQNTDTTKTRKFAIGLSYSPDYCYRTLKPEASVKWVADLRDSIEIPKLGFTTGLNFIYQLKKRVAIETGFHYSNKGQGQNPITLITIQPEPSLPNKIAYKYHYYYLDIPVKVNYSITTSRLRFFVSGGFSTNLFLYQKTTTISEYSDGHTTTKNTIRKDVLSKTNFAFLAGLGINYALTNRLILNFEPTYRRSINSIVESPIKGYLYSVGLNTGLYFKL